MADEKEAKNGKKKGKKKERISDEYDGDDVTEEALNKFLPEIHDELYYDLISWPEPETKEHLLSVLVEEVGEVARAINDNNEKAYHDELIQVAAVAISMIWKYEEAKKNGEER